MSYEDRIAEHGRQMAARIMEVNREAILTYDPREREILIRSVLATLTGSLVGLLTITLNKPPSQVAPELLKTLASAFELKYEGMDRDWNIFMNPQPPAQPETPSNNVIDIKTRRQGNPPSSN